MSGVLTLDNRTLHHKTATEDGDRKQYIGKAATPDGNGLVAFDKAICPLFATTQTGGDGRLIVQTVQGVVDVPF